MEIEKADDLGQPRNQYTKALAALITVNSPPTPEGYKEKDNRHLQTVRPKSAKLEHFNELISELVTSKMGRNKSSTQVQSFAIATLATGLRPIEWVESEIKIATEKDMPDGQSCKGHMVLTIQTAKKKSTDKKSCRDIIIAPGTELDHIHQHIHLRSEFIARSKMSEDAAAAEYARECSRIIRSTCTRLWPMNPDRWMTLYTLRGQAAANFKQMFGKEIAAAICGHSTKIAAGHYAPQRKANLAKMKMTVQAGPESLRIAQEMIPEQSNAAEVESASENPGVSQSPF